MTQTQATTTSAYQQLRGHLHYLRLDAAAEALPAALDHARQAKLSHTSFLEHLLAIEVQATQTRRQQSRLRFAAFPAPWRLEDFDFDAQPGVDRALVQELATLRFIDEKANVLLIGPPGVGKTHLALALGHLAVDAGYRVCYVTAADLVARCHRAAIEGRWATTMRSLGPDLRRPHGRRGHARPAAAPLHRAADRRGVLPHARPPRPRRGPPEGGGAHQAWLDRTRHRLAHPGNFGEQQQGISL